MKHGGNHILYLEFLKFFVSNWGGNRKNVSVYEKETYLLLADFCNFGKPVSILILDTTGNV